MWSTDWRRPATSSGHPTRSTGGARSSSPPLPRRRCATAIARIDQTLETVLSGYSDVEQQQAIRAFLNATASAVSRETETLRASVRGGFVGKAYQAPLAERDARRPVLRERRAAPGDEHRAAGAARRRAGHRRAERVTRTIRGRRAGWRPGGRDLRRAAAGRPAPRPGPCASAIRARALAALTTREAKVALSSAIPWAIEIEGGLTELSGSLTAVSLERLELDGGANHINLRCPGPAARRSSASAASSAAPGSSGRAECPLHCASTAASRISCSTASATRNVSGERRVASKDFASSADSYEIDVRGGANVLAIKAQTPGAHPWPIWPS